MIYFDNAATTLLKPAEVFRAVQSAMRTAAGFGRSGHRPALRAGELVYACREEAAALFGVGDPTRVAFTLNATHALNLAIHALVKEDTVAAVTGYEHNSVMRPLAARGTKTIVMRTPLFQPAAILPEAERAIAAGANLFIINHVSNVFGFVQPLEALDGLLAKHGIPMIVDASQSAGVVPVNAGALRAAAAVCCPGHKALFGPQGTGILLVLSDAVREPLLTGGTGSLSEQLSQPDFLPDRFESGTLNAHGIAGLGAGIAWVRAQGVHRIYGHERRLVTRLTEGMRALPGTEVFAGAGQSGVLSFRVNGRDCEEIAGALAAREVCVRDGLHCAPEAHRTAGTFDTGTVRLSLSAMNTETECDRFLTILEAIILHKKRA